MFENERAIITALHNTHSVDLGQGVTLFERLCSGQLTNKGLQGILDQLKLFGKFGQILSQRKKESLEFLTIDNKVREFVLGRLKEAAEQAEAMVSQNHRELIRRFNETLWNTASLEFNLHGPITVPPLPDIDPNLLQYLQRQLQYAIVYLPGTEVIKGSMIDWMGDGYLYPVNFRRLPKIQKGAGVRPEGVKKGWYAVEKILPSIFPSTQHDPNKDDLARVMKFSTRYTTWRKLNDEHIPAITRFLGIPRESVCIPSAEELVLCVLLAPMSGCLPFVRVLNMLSDFRCEYWGDSRYPEICRNRADATLLKLKNTAEPGVVLGGLVPEGSGYDRVLKISCEDLNGRVKGGFRIMIDLTLCSGVEFGHYTPYYTYDD